MDKIVEIDRRTWARGRQSVMLNDAGKRDVFGFIFTYSGMPDAMIRHMGSCAALFCKVFGTEHQKHMLDWMTTRQELPTKDSNDANLIASINDHTKMSDDNREVALSEMLAAFGIELRFIN